MDSRRPRLSADDLRRIKWLLGLALAVLAAWTVPFMGIASLGLPAVVTVAAGVLALRPDWAARVPRVVHTLAFPTVAAAAAADWLLYRDLLPTFVRLGLLLILYRIISYRRRREELQLIVLGLFLVVVAGVLTVSLAFAVQILAFTACALGLLLAVTLADAEGAEPVPTPGVVPAWALAVRWGEVWARARAAADWRVVVLGGGLFAGLVVVSGLLFLAIPRFELNNSLFLDRLVNRQTRTGFSDEIRFGEVTRIQQDNGLALSVDVADPAQVPAMPYWRMVVLDDYTREGFRLSSELRTQLNRSAARTTRLRGTARFRRDATDWTFYLEPGISRYLPLLGNFSGLMFPEPQMAGQSDPLRVVALQTDPPKMTAYRVTGLESGTVLPDADLALKRRAGESGAGSAAGRPNLDEVDRARLQRMVAEILPNGAPIPAAEFAQSASRWLAARHRYALESEIPPGLGDPLVRWLGSSEPGHCEFFAGAFVLLAREAGYAARIVTGFKGGSWNAYSNSYTIRNSDAHAWVELFDDRAGGWLRVDPTPGALTIGEPAVESAAGDLRQGRIDDSWSARLDSLRVFWYRRVVNFDQSSQVELVSSLRTATESTTRRMRDGLEAALNRVRAWLTAPWDGRQLVSVVVALGALAGVVLLWRRGAPSWWLRWRSARAQNAGLDPVRREAGRWLFALNQDVAGRTTDAAAIEAALLRLRYGPKASWPDPAPVLREAARLIRSRRRARGQLKSRN